MAAVKGFSAHAETESKPQPARFEERPLEETLHTDDSYDPRTSARDRFLRNESATGTSLGQTFAGACAAVLAVWGLVGASPAFALGISVIVLGVALLFQGGGVTARYRRLIAVVDEDRFRGMEIENGMAGEFLAAVAIITLGVLALLGVVPAIGGRIMGVGRR